MADVKSFKEKQNQKFRCKSYMQNKQENFLQTMISLFFLISCDVFIFFSFLSHPNYRLVC